MIRSFGFVLKAQRVLIHSLLKLNFFLKAVKNSGCFKRGFGFLQSRFVHTIGVLTGVVDEYIAMGRSGILCGEGGNC